MIKIAFKLLSIGDTFKFFPHSRDVWVKISINGAKRSGDDRNVSVNDMPGDLIVCSLKGE